MLKAFIGKKLGMTSIFTEQGEMVPVTVIAAEPMTVMQVKTPDKEKYAAVQLGAGEKKLQRAKKPELGHARKAGTSPKKVLKEFRVPEEELENYKPGQTITLADLGLEKGDLVDVTGTSKGKGYAGVMKRHGFHGFSKTHGTHEYLRHGGSIGCATTPGRVWKGKKMAGHLGAERVTVKNLEVVDIRVEDNLVLVKGAVPGHREAVVFVKASPRPKKKSEAA